MVAVLRIVAIPIWVSVGLLLTPVMLLVTMLIRDEEKYHAKETDEKQTESLESAGRVELLRRFTYKPMATVSVHRSAEAQRRGKLVPSSAEEEDSLLPRKLRENGPRRQDERPEESLRRIRTKSVRYW